MDIVISVYFILLHVCYRSCFEWESKPRSIIALVTFIVLCYYFEPYMIPIALLLIFLKYYIVSISHSSVCGVILWRSKPNFSPCHHCCVTDVPGIPLKKEICSTLFSDGFVWHVQQISSLLYNQCTRNTWKKYAMPWLFMIFCNMFNKCWPYDLSIVSESFLKYLDSFWYQGEIFSYIIEQHRWMKCRGWNVPSIKVQHFFIWTLHSYNYIFFNS